MDDAQKMLVESNIRLVYYFYDKLSKSPLVLQNGDDLISEGFLGLVKAAKSFVPEKAKFCTYAARCIKNQMLMYIRKIKRHEQVVSIYTPLQVDDNGFETQYIDIISDNTDFTYTSEELITLDSYINTLCERDKNIIELKKEGLTHRQIGEKTNYSQSYVSRLLAKIRTGYNQKYSAEVLDF